MTTRIDDKPLARRLLKAASREIIHAGVRFKPCAYCLGRRTFLLEDCFWCQGSGLGEPIGAVLPRPTTPVNTTPPHNDDGEPK